MTDKDEKRSYKEGFDAGKKFAELEGTTIEDNLNEFKKVFYHNVAKHGQYCDYTDFREYVDSLTPAELLDILLDSGWDRH